MAFFHGFIDDSGTDPQQPVANATVLIIPSARIIALEREWNRLREKEGFATWHTAPFVARNREYEFADWDDSKRDRVFERVRSICKKYCVQPMSFSVYKPDYDEVVLARLPFADKHHYTWAIRQMLSHTERWRNFNKVPQPLEYVFSWMGEKRNNERRQEIEDLLDQCQEEAREQGIPGEFDHWAFRRADEIPALQCVDALAWSVYQFGQLAFCKKSLSANAQKAWNDFGGYLNGKWGFDVSITRDNLKKWVDAEIADGRSVKKFAAWHERKDAEKQQRIREIRRNDAPIDSGSTQQDKGEIGRGESRKKAKA